MANLAIKGHPTRGEEVIKILEMLGGKNDSDLIGAYNDCYYIIAQNGGIIYNESMLTDYENTKVLTLEQFERLYPYIKGDFVNFNGLICIVKDAWWAIDEVRYIIANNLNTYNVGAYDIEAIKEENMSIPEAIKANANCANESVKAMNQNSIKMGNKTTVIFEYKQNGNETELVIPDNMELVLDNGKYLIKDKKPQYPKFPDECCDFLGTTDSTVMSGYRHELLYGLQKLLICRDAYWKLAGDWRPTKGKHVYYIYYSFASDKVRKGDADDMYGNVLLAFPTEEMRDAFYENFKSLIEECKELL